MARINLEAIKKEDEIRNKKYVWEKDLVINGRVIKDIRKGGEYKLLKVTANGDQVFYADDAAGIIQWYRIIGKIYPKSGLKYLQVEINGNVYKLVQQNPKTTSKWAELARTGKEVVQVINASNGKYMGVYVDGVYNKY